MSETTEPGDAIIELIETINGMLLFRGTTTYAQPHPKNNVESTVVGQGRRKKLFRASRRTVRHIDGGNNSSIFSIRAIQSRGDVMRVLVFCNERAVRDQLSHALASNGCDAAFLGSLNHDSVGLEQEKVDCLIFDVRSWRRDAIERIRQLRARTIGVPIFAINVFDSADDRMRVIEAGADDCIPEPLTTAEFMARLRIVVHRFTATQRRNTSAGVFRKCGLTKAECRVASLLARGRKLAQIAAELNISRNTVRSQLRSIFDKTGVRRQAELVFLLLTNYDSSSAADLPSWSAPSLPKLRGEVADRIRNGESIPPPSAY